MDAHNLAVVICPNLVKSSDPMQDVLLCSIPNGPWISSTPSTITTPAQAAPISSPETSDGGTTLGSIVKLCIQRYHEIFDEVHDRTEAVPPSTQRSPSPPSSEGSSSSQLKQARPLSLRSDDEDIDDAVLVMPIGPSGSGTTSTNENLASVWGSSGTGADSNVLPYQPRRRKFPANGTSNGGGGSESSVGFVNDESNNGAGRRHRSPARSTISIELPGSASGSGRGSISIGRGTHRKASGSGVEAMGITADGFFTPPSAASPVPTPTKRRAWL
jgi:Rho GTPase-activating protein 1